MGRRAVLSGLTSRRISTFIFRLPSVSTTISPGSNRRLTLTNPQESPRGTNPSGLPSPVATLTISSPTRPMAISVAQVRITPTSTPLSSSTYDLSETTIFRGSKPANGRVCSFDWRDNSALEPTNSLVKVFPVAFSARAKGHGLLTNGQSPIS